MFSFTRLSATSLCLITALFAQTSMGASSSASTSSKACNQSSSSIASSIAPPPTTPLTCNVAVTNQWTGGYQIDVKVGNTGTIASDKWTVVVDVPASDIVVSTWNANKIAQDQNAYTYANLSWNSVIAPKSTVSFGMQFSYSGSARGTPTCHVQTGTVNHAPTADFTAQVINDTVHIKATNGVDADGDKLTYTFDFGDGKSIVYNDVWHTYKTPGTYTVTQTVSDGKLSSTKTHTVTVTAPGTNRAPIAIYSFYTNGFNVSANAKASADLDNNALTYSWDAGNGATTPSTTSTTQVAVNGNGGGYVTLTVFDGQLGNTIQYWVYTSSCSITDPAPNISFSTAIDGSTLKVNASETTNADAFTWDFGDGSTGTGLLATHTYAVPGTYLVTLRANAQMMTATKTATVVIAGSVGGLPPVVGQLSCSGYTQIKDDFVNYISTTTFETYCALTGSSDPEGAPLLYTINWGDGTEQVSNLTNFKHSYTMLKSNMTITIKVSDGTNVSLKAIPFYTGEPVIVNLPPVAELNCVEHVAVADNFTTGVATYTYTTACDASASTDPEGKPLSYGLSWGDGGSTEFNTTGKFLHTYAAGGEYGLLLTVDDGAAHTYKTLNWTASSGAPGNHPPVACFGLGGTGTATVTLDTACASDPDHDALSFSWSFGDGATATGSTATHTYAASGNYTITLTANDGKTTTSSSYVFSYVAPVKTSHCKFEVISSWAGGFQGNLTVYNDSNAPIVNWQALLTFPPEESISSYFNGTVTGTNPYTIKGSWNTTIPVGGSVQTGFLLWKTNAAFPTTIPTLAGPACQ